MASPSTPPPVSHSSGSDCNDGSGGRDGRVAWNLVNSALYIPSAALWMPLSSPHGFPLKTRSIFLLPPFHLHLVFASINLALPLPGLAFFRVNPDITSRSPASLPLATTLFAGFHDVDSKQTYKLALQFPSTPRLFQFVETAIKLGARYSPRLKRDLSLFLSSSPADVYFQAGLDGNPVSTTQKGVPEFRPVSGIAAYSIPLAVPENAVNCRVIRMGQGIPLATVVVQQNVTPEPVVYDAHSDNLNLRLTEPVLKKRCTRVDPMLRLFPTTALIPNIPAASSIPMKSGGECLGSGNDNARHSQMSHLGLAASGVEDGQQSVNKYNEDELDKGDGSDHSQIRASNRSQEQSLHQPECELDTRTVEVTDTHASKDLLSGDLRSELLGCLLDPSFHLLVARVENLLVEISNPDNIDLASVAEYLSRK